MSAEIQNYSNIIMISIPKAGTHLLQRCIELLTSCTLDNKHFYNIPFKALNYPTPEILTAMITSIKPNNFGSFHLRFDQTYAALFAELNIRVIFITRDPRDQLVSRVNYIKKGGYPDFKFSRLPFHALLSSFIGEMHQPFIGIESFNHRANKNAHKLCNIQQLYQEFLPWQQQSCCYTTTFEKLIGARGGGSDELQLQEIKNIAHHINVAITDDQAREIGAKLFGNTHTFVKGQIGTWKQYFLPHHKEAFNKVAPTLLQELEYASDNTW